MNEKNENTLIGLLSKKKALLAEMLGSTRKALELLKNDDIEEFEREIGRCEDMMRKADELAEEEKAYAKDDKQPGQQAISNEIESILRELSQASEECKKASGEKLKEYGSRIKALRQTKQGIGVYAPQTNPDAIFFDAKQ